MLYHISFLAAAASLSYAAPTVSEIGQAEFSVVQERDTLGDISPAALLLRPYAKYADRGAVAPKALVEAAQSDSQQGGLLSKRQSTTGSVVANPGNTDDIDMVSPVTVGGQGVRLAFDTGASDLWVFSSLQPSSQTQGHSVYNPSKSGTKKLISGATWGIATSDGRDANGTVYADRVVVGSVTATSQAVQAATSVSSSVTEYTWEDGEFGLAFIGENSVKPVKQQSWFDSVKSQLKSKVFAADLKMDARGSWDFGYINTTKYTGSITYLSVNNATGNATGLWGFTAGGYNFGSNKTMIGSQGVTIADTGTSASFIPDAAAKAYYAKVANIVMAEGGYYCFPCSTTLPDFQTSLGGRVFTVPGKLLNYANIGQQVNGQHYCLGGLQPKQTLPFNVYGLTFLKAWYVVFEQASSKPRIGFATKNL